MRCPPLPMAGAYGLVRRGRGRTCGGDFSRKSGYRENLVVYARLSRTK